MTNILVKHKIELTPSPYRTLCTLGKSNVWSLTHVLYCRTSLKGKGHYTFNFSIKDKFYGPYKTMAIQFYL